MSAANNMIDEILYALKNLLFCLILAFSNDSFKNTLEVLDGYVENPDNTKEENKREYQSISQIYPKLLGIANQYYDMVFVDLARELDDEIQQKILQLSNLNIYVAVQKITSLDKYINLLF